MNEHETHTDSVAGAVFSRLLSELEGQTPWGPALARALADLRAGNELGRERSLLQVFARAAEEEQWFGS